MGCRMAERNAIGGGPYTLVKNTPGVEVILEANKGYWQKTSLFRADRAQVRA